MAEIGEGLKERARKEFERATMELARNLALGKFPGTHKDDPTKTLSNSGEGA